MEIDLYTLLQSDQVLVIFTVITFGYLIGKLNIFGAELGNVTGVLLAGLILGALGFHGSAVTATLGFTIFIFCVGLQAGPSFFSAFAADGARYLGLSLIVAGVAVVLCLIMQHIFELDLGFSAGMLAGALTSTPTLVGAQDAVSSGLAVLPEGVQSQDVIKNISVAYSLTYLFGMGGLMFVIKYIPTIFRVDLAEEARKISCEKTISRQGLNEHTLPMVRTYLINKEKLFGKTIRQIQEANNQYFTVLGIRRDGALIDVDGNTIVEEGDVISVIASVAQHSIAKERDIQEVFDRELLNFRIRTKEITVTNSDFIGQTAGNLSLSAKYGCYIIGMLRAGIALPVDANTVLQKGDKIEVIGEENLIGEVSERLGSIEADVEKTDLLTMCMGVTLGLMLGTIVLKFGQISVGLGSAGGLLLVGILIGFLRSVYPTFGVFPRAARNIMMDLGIVLFMCSIGLNAGSKVFEALTSVGPILMVCGICITVIPVLVAFAVGKYVMKMNQALLLGAITGAMTSTSSLNLVTESAKSQVPALGYAGSYTFANVILTFAGAILMLF